MAPLTFFSLIFMSAFVNAQYRPIIRLDNGLLLQGTVEEATNGREYLSFRGIPYALPPVGENRFKDPQPLRSWFGILDASKFGNTCMQYNPIVDQALGNEDCLYINVWTPQQFEDRCLPVIVYIHGGVFLYGSSEFYTPSNFMNMDVVFVTMNYRLGPMGFISTGDDVISGNMGLKDQSFALKWVQKYIKTFGGDPDNVTLMGHASVIYHLISEKSEGTFNRAIAMSGTALAPWAFASKPVENVRTLGNLLGCHCIESEELVACLRNKSASDIVLAQKMFFDWQKDVFFTPFGPTIEPREAPNYFLNQHPYLVLKHGFQKKVPVILTNTAQDGLYPAAAYLREESILEDLEIRWETLASEAFIYNHTSPNELRRFIASKIQKEYFNGQPVNRKTFTSLVQALTDRLYATSLAETARLLSSGLDQPVYVMRYNFDGGYSFASLLARSYRTYGAGHLDDVLHIFTPYTGESPDDAAMTKLLVSMLYSYATSGVPTLPGKLQWSPTPVMPGSSKLDFLELTSPTEVEMKSDYDYGHKSFWEGLKFNENMNYYAPHAY